MNSEHSEAVDALLDRRAELREQGLAITAEELCRDVPTEIREEVAARLARIEAAENAVVASFEQLATGLSEPFIPAGSTGRYASPRVQAEGGMGVLCLADDVELKRPVAYKVMKPGLRLNSFALSKFFHEAEITAALNHPGVLPVYGRVTDDSGMPAYASAFVPGRSLAWRIGVYRALSPIDQAARASARATLLTAFLDTCEVAAYAHSRHIVHGDIKPSNILTDDFGATWLVDWGLARVLDIDSLPDDEETPLQRLGTFPFQSSFDKPATRASDIYSLGMTLALIMAETPSRDVPAPRPATDAPPALWTVAQKAMSLDRAGRYDSVMALAADVRAVLADRPVAVYKDPWKTQLRRWTNRHRVGVLASTATTIALLLVAASAGPFIVKRERNLRTRAENERGRALQITRELLYQTDHVGQVQATLPRSKELLTRAVGFVEQWARDGETDGNDLGPAAEYYYRAGLIYEKLRQLDEAAVCYQKSAERAQRRLRAHPDDDASRNLWAAALRGSGVVKILQGGDQEATSAWKQAIVLLSPIASRSAEARWTLVRLYSALGNQELLVGHQTNAQASYETGRALAQELVAHAPTDPRYLKSLADMNLNFGVSLYHQAVPGGKSVADAVLLERSKQTLLEALALRKRLTALEPDAPEHLAGLASNLKLLGNDAFFQGTSGEAEAVRFYTDARTLLEELVVTFPAVSTHRQELAQVYSNLNVVLSKQKRFQEARGVADAAVNLFHRVLKDHPDSPETLSDLGIAQIQRADTIARLGDPAATRAAQYEAAISFASAAHLTQEPNRREALSKQALKVLVALRNQGFFKDPDRAAALSTEPAFSEIRQRPDFPRP